MIPQLNDKCHVWHRVLAPCLSSKTYAFSRCKQIFNLDSTCVHKWACKTCSKFHIVYDSNDLILTELLFDILSRENLYIIQYSVHNICKMEKTNSPWVEMESDDVDIKHEPLEADMEYYVSIKGV